MCVQRRLLFLILLLLRLSTLDWNVFVTTSLNLKPVVSRAALAHGKLVTRIRHPRHDGRH
jgi:hypothetical protein